MELAAGAKRPRAVSAEMSLSKRPGLTTRLQSKLLEELEGSVSDDDGGENSGFHHLSQLVDEAEPSESEELPVL